MNHSTLIEEQLSLIQAVIDTTLPLPKGMVRHTHASPSYLAKLVHSTEEFVVAGLLTRGWKYVKDGLSWKRVKVRDEKILPKVSEIPLEIRDTIVKGVTADHTMITMAEKTGLPWKTVKDVYQAAHPVPRKFSARLLQSKDYSTIFVVTPATVDRRAKTDMIGRKYYSGGNRVVDGGNKAVEYNHRRAYELRKTGMAYAAIAKKIGAPGFAPSPSTVRNWVKAEEARRVTEETVKARANAVPSKKGLGFGGRLAQFGSKVASFLF